jgi:hypothetical protein
MNTVIIPELRSNSDCFNNSYTRILSNGVIEHYNKEYYNQNLTRKSSLEDIQKEILLFQIEELIHS